jgi:hypothetical protein
MRTEINYKKEGFTQIFPVLYITNDKEKAWVFGFGKKNIAFVSGENDYYKENKERFKNGGEVLYNNDGLVSKFDKLKTNEKFLLVVSVFAVAGLFMYVYNKRRK